MLLRQILAHRVGRERHVRRADGLVRILRAGLGLERARAAGVILRTVVRDDERFRRLQRFVGQALRVGTHIRDETDRTAAGNVHALIELLRDGHRAPGRHAQTAGRLLLQRGGDERGRRAALLLPALDVVNPKRRRGHRLNDAVGLGFARHIHLFFRRAVKAGGELLSRFAAAKQRVEQPILLALEIADLVFPIHNNTRGHGLYTPRRKAGLDLLPQQRAELVAHDAVENAARLLRVHKILVDLARVLNALRDDLLRNLVERHTLGLFIVQIQQFLQMPRDGLALAVRVGCEIDGVRGLRFLLQIVNHVFPALDGQVFRHKAALNIDAQRAFRQVTQVPHRGYHLVVRPQIFFNRSGFRRRFHDHQIRLCFCHSE